MKVKSSIRERSLRAFLDLVILRLLAEHSMSAYEINKALTKKFHAMIGPSTIYSKLSTLEEKGDICHVNSRSGKEYSLTEHGHETINDISAIIAEITESAKELLECRNES